MPQLEGLTERVMISGDPQSAASERWEQVRVNMEGIEGDKHAGLTRRADARTPHFKRGTIIRNSRQVTLVSVEELAEIAALMNLPRIEPEWLGANLLVSGVPNLTMLPPSTRLFFPDDAVLVVEGENEPCIKPGRVIQSRYPDIPKLANKFPRAAVHKRGLLAWVERAGLIKTGDRVRVEVPVQVIYSFPDQ